MNHEPLIADDVPYPSRVQSHAALTAGMAVRSDAAAKLAGNGGYLTDRQTPACCMPPWCAARIRMHGSWRWM